MMAAMSNQAEVVERLVKLAECDINMRGLGLNTALTFAAGQGYCQAEWSSLIGPDHSRYCAVIGPDHSRYCAVIGHFVCVVMARLKRLMHRKKG